MAAKAARPLPLAFMTQLSPCVYFYKPPSAPSPPSPSAASQPATKSGSPPPRLILLATWMGAKPVHIAKYIDPYRALFPGSPILLVRSEMPLLLLPRKARRELEPAAAIVKSYFPEIEKGRNDAVPKVVADIDSVSNADLDSDSDSALGVTSISSLSSSFQDSASASPSPAPAGHPKLPELLIHVWSNGGSFMLNYLRGLLPAQPPYTIVLDSTPGQFSYGATMRAISQGLKPWIRRLLWPVLHLQAIWMWVMHRLRPGGSPFLRVAAALNSPTQKSSEVRRTYVYSDTDDLVYYKHVEQHADAAKAKGFDTRAEMFKGAGHVAMARSEPERYWRLVKETWDGENGVEKSGQEESGEVGNSAPAQ